MPNNGLNLAKALGGMNPEQAQRATQMAVQALQQRQSQQQQSQQFDRKMKLKKVDMVLQQRAQKMKNAIAQQKADAYEQMATAQSLNAQTSYANSQRKLRELEMKEQINDILRNKTFTLENGEEISGITAAAMSEKDINVKLAGPDKVEGTFADSEGNVKALVVRNGKLQASDEFEDLQGFETMPSKETEVRLGPGEVSQRRKEGTQRAEVKSSDWAQDFREDVLYSKDEKVYTALTAGRGEEKLKAKQKAREYAAEELSTVLGGEEVRFGKYKGKIGFWREGENGELEFVRGDI